VLSSEQDLPEVFVLECLFLDRSKISYHLARSLFLTFSRGRVFMKVLGPKN
jgi:hypothetical protein